jgi:hypothetical protein
MQNSGKLLILAMFVVALAAAATSWWFRYEATHKAAQFWGPAAALLVRDAPAVELNRLVPAGSSDVTTVRAADDVYQLSGGRDISSAPGLTHLRGALLEDRSYSWPAHPPEPGTHWSRALVFRGRSLADTLTIALSDDFKYALKSYPGQEAEVVSCEPIAGGLAETINDWSHNDPAAASR